MGWIKTAEELREDIINKNEAHNQIKARRKRIAIFAAIFLLLSVLILWYNVPTRLGQYVYIERDLTNHKQTIHTNSSCSRIKKGYSVNETNYYTYKPYFDEFCSKCVYESDAIKLTKGENRMSHTKDLGL